MTQQLSELAKTVINNTGLFDGAREFNFDERVTRNGRRAEALVSLAQIAFKEEDLSRTPHNEKKRGLDLAVRFLGIISSAIPRNLQKGFWEALATYAGEEANALD